MKVNREQQRAPQKRHAPRTRLEDLEELGPELGEEQLRAVAGGYFASGGSTGGPCGACH